MAELVPSQNQAYSVATIRAAFWDTWHDRGERYFGRAYLLSPYEVTALYWEAFQANLAAAHQCRLAPALAAIRALQGVNGNLHIVLDDENYEDDNVQYCMRLNKEAEERGDGNSTAEWRARERACMVALLALDECDRQAANEQYDAEEVEKVYQRYPDKRPGPCT